MPLTTALVLPLLMITPVPGPAPAPGTAAESGWQDHTLGNGIPVTLIPAPDSPKQHFFAMLPHGLLADAAGHTQYAHLLEHMAIRATDADVLEADGITMNGETSGLMLRLDTYAVPDNWREAIRKQGRWVAEWIAPTVLDPAVLEREKERIQGEETSTAHNGYTHKWADAAWAQVVRHGQTVVRLHGDVADATPDSIREYAAEQKRTASGVRLVSIGPADLNEVLALVEEVFGALDTSAPGPRPATVAADTVTTPADYEATWDLPADHYLEWYPLPDESHEDRLAGMVVSQILMMNLTRGPLRDLGVNVYASPDLVTPEGRWLKLSANVPDGVAIDQIQSVLRQTIEGAQHSPAALLQNMAGGLAMQFEQAQDLTALRKQYAARGMANDFLEGNAVLGLVNLEWMTGVSRTELRAAAEGLKGEALAALLKTGLAVEKRSTLVLRGD